MSSPGVVLNSEAAAKTRAAQELLQNLDTAASVEERLKWIADGATYRERVSKFFAAHPEGLGAAAVDPNVGSFTELPSGAEVKMHVATTKSCPTGAMVRLRPAAGKELLDWPLFEQTHQLEFDRFAGEPDDKQARWFTMLCARTRKSDLAAEAQEAYLTLSAQGSLSAKGEVRLYVKADSDVGRYIASRIVWGRVYLTQMFVEHAVVDEKPVLIVKDCAGTTTAGR